MKNFIFKNKRKLKPTIQVAQTECGLCCVRTILEAYGCHKKLTDLRQIKEPGRDGLGLTQLKELLMHMGMDVQTYKIKDLRAFEVVDFPIIAFWKGYHFVCIELFSEKYVIIMDPSIGRIKISINEFQKDFSQYILVAKPNKNFVKVKKNKLDTWKKDYIWPNNMMSLYLGLLMTSIILVIMTLSIPIFTQSLIDKSSYLNSISFVKTIELLLLAIITMIGLNTFRSYLSIKISYKFNWHLLVGAFAHTLSLPAKFFTVRSPGEVIFRLNSLTRIQDVLGITLVQTFLDIVSSIVILGYIFWSSWTLGIIIVTLIMFMFLFLIITQKYVDSATDKELREGSSVQSIQLDALASINSVKLGGYVQSYFSDWKDKLTKLLSASSHRMYLQQGIVGSVLYGMQTIFPLIILVISLYQEKLGTLSLGQVIAIQSTVSMLFNYSNTIFSTLSNIMVVERYIELSEDIFDYPIESSVRSDHIMESGNLSINNLYFQYTSDTKPALKNINLKILDGETVAFVGVSGSGKTTLAKICSSLFEPTKGDIFFSDINFQRYNLDQLRKSISYIPQEAHLHNRTIIENLKLGSQLSEEKIIELCSSLEFLSFISDLPMGYNTVISEMGANLSGGQRQRIHIARAILQNPKILIMDEATSSLDNISQSSVYTELSKLECTKIVIAHRLETILNADKIFVLRDGEIVQTGHHNDLVQQPGDYKDLFNTVIEKEK
ncbi:MULTISPECIES: peptidase domain-containing ABC transporter [Enterococcus]|uniref:peptidase domain-containing ABC transporter n=1 Tax=Enterococcus TaxID=1350 RepID=UPI00032F1E4D|nr:peptidase domain-containing ABC transporter [Enterococcus faecalis]EGO2628640.1 peptidase domain-containing ABC transporter [Enterococcus faecalis]EGO2651672.1 peptidase domain-containing ABC transporter [Enterococcus faecalis]EGO2682674.1 peptidase domain-containing ABC transporter [Enterococcus faecalis]EGO2724551.1 peptidase domain-containing ABC transporter [Enterococcus faecalis]EGO5163478.1 peptidase domain-containing ABC transporter [Enterococcus faecalis]